MIRNVPPALRPESRPKDEGNSCNAAPGNCPTSSPTDVFNQWTDQMPQRDSEWERANESDLPTDPEEPTYSDTSLVCVIPAWGKKTHAVIVDRDAGMIHFQNSHAAPAFLPTKPMPWFSCPLSDIKSVSRWSFKGTTTLVIETPQGKADISSRASNFAELCASFDEIGTTYPPGQAPLDGPQCVILLGCVVGLIVGFMVPTPRAGILWLVVSPILGVLVFGGGSVLCVWAGGGFEKQK